METCDYLFGVKEVPPEALIPDKTYLFFSHTIKAQAHNRPLMRALLAKRIRMIDYETVQSPLDGERVAAFGRQAGIAGAYNGIRAMGLKTGAYELPAVEELADSGTIFKILRELRPAGKLL